MHTHISKLDTVIWNYVDLTLLLLFEDKNQVLFILNFLYLEKFFAQCEKL